MTLATRLRMKNEIKRKGFPFRPGAHEFDLHVRLRARNSFSLVSIYFQFAQPCFDIRLLIYNILTTMLLIKYQTDLIGR